jgi:hypothetical protein
MNEPDIEYRGHYIVVRSYESEGTQWRPKALVSIYHSGTVHRRMLVAPVDVRFGSEDAADTCALALAKKWIDDHAGHPMP